MLNTEEILATLQAKLPELEQEYCVLRIGIFGSYARGDQTEASDIDFVVRFRADCSDLFETKYRLRKFLGSLFGKEVDVANVEYLKPYILQDILNEARYAV